MRPHLLLVASVVFFGCPGPRGEDGADGTNGVDGRNGSLVRVRVASAAECPTGGKTIEVGVDDDGDGTLDDSEIESTDPVCNGANGANGVDGTNGADGMNGTNGTNGVDGFNSLTTISAANAMDCPAGGWSLATGLDNGDGAGVARDGVLQTGEVDSTAVVCNGVDGQDGTNGARSLVSVTNAPAANCPAGGKQIDSGVDDGDGGGVAHDGLLQAGEIDGTSYVCNGANGANAPQPPTCTGAWRVARWNGTSYECVDLRSTGASMGRANGFETTDAWGLAWDGISRGAANWAAAKFLCESEGGRLPTATELSRLNATSGSGQLGNSNVSEWTVLSQSPSARVGVRLSDGLASLLNASNSAPYRCVWPPPPGTDAFLRCHGPPGAECFRLGALNVDAYDRPPLPHAAAVQECGQAFASVPTLVRLTEAVQAGLPNGSNLALWRQTHEGYNGTSFLVGTANWLGTNTAFTPTSPGSVAWNYYTDSTLQAFRCVGPRTAPTPSALPASGFTESRSKLRFTQTDAAATTYAAAAANCRSLGGHLPSHRDLMLGVTGGLPGGSNQWLWVSDVPLGSTGGLTTYASLARWSGTDLNYTGQFSTYATWAQRSATYGSRCVFFPRDPGFTPPASCNGGCFTSTVLGTTVVADSADRTATSLGGAIRACAALGGRLASYLDYAELIAAGLSGSGSDVWTSSFSRYDLAKVLRWTTTPWGDTTADAPFTAAYGYRCVWGNELRD